MGSLGSWISLLITVLRPLLYWNAESNRLTPWITLLTEEHSISCL
jgi:hypothetical protein